MGSSGGGVETGQFILQKGGIMGFGGGAASLGNGHFENWGDSAVVADHSHQTDASTDTDDKNQVFFFWLSYNLSQEFPCLVILYIRVSY